MPKAPDTHQITYLKNNILGEKLQQNTWQGVRVVVLDELRCGRDGLGVLIQAWEM